MTYHKHLPLIVTGAIATGVLAAVGWYFRQRFFGKKKYQVVFVIGGPGAGKGTQCVLISQNFGYTHLSAGDLLRAEMKSGSEMADMINAIIKDGRIVPSEITTSLLLKAMEESGNTKFLIDGFPRNLENLRCWEKLATDLCEVQFLLYLDCPEEVMMQRLLVRGQTSGRVDDNIETIKKRFKTNRDDISPILEYFRGVGKLRSVDSSTQVNEVFQDISMHFQNANWGVM